MHNDEPKVSPATLRARLIGKVRWGAFHLTKNSGYFGTRANGTEIKSESVDFPKCEPFNEESRKLQEQNRMELKFSGKFFRNLGLPSENFEKHRHFTLNLSSFGRKFSDLGMQLKAATCVKM